jgi:hypothetical protein
MSSFSLRWTAIGSGTTSEIGQNLVGVFTQQRRPIDRPGRQATESDGRVDDGHRRSRARVLDVYEHLSRLDVWIGENVVEVVDGGDGDAAAQQRDDLVFVEHGRPLRQG